MKYFKKFVGQKLYLSPMNILDAEKYTMWMNDRSVTDPTGSTVKITSIEGEKEWIANASKNGDANFAIVDVKTDELLGNCSLMNINRINRSCTVGIFIGDEEKRNKGYGKEALKLLLNYAFNMENMHNVNLEVFSFNERAIKCYSKVGFKEYGRRHEVYFLDGKYFDIIEMEILEEDFRKESN